MLDGGQSCSVVVFEDSTSSLGPLQFSCVSLAAAASGFADPDPKSWE